MSKISVIHFRYLRGEAHYQYLTLFKGLLDEFTVVRNTASSFYADLVTLLAQEKQVVDQQKSSDYTQQIADADHRDDRLITGIRDVVDAAMHHFTPATVVAAKFINLRLKTFGEIQSKTYEEEVTAIDILLDDLQSPEYTPKVTLIGLTPWVTELRLAVNDFKRLLRLRSVESAGKPEQRLREIRKQIEAVYHNIIDRIHSAATLDTNNAYTEFIKRLNVQIAYFNDHNHHPAPINMRTADVDALPIQPYTGKSITPIPVVHLGGSELFFAKDFTLTYKNNLNPGVAEISIAGKGNYGGQKVVTFNIEELKTKN
jgi:hypothetical protein